MKFANAFVPVGGSWSSPFVKWQGSLSDVSSFDLAVAVTRRALEERKAPLAEISTLILGWTVPQQAAFYGAPTVAARIGLEAISGPMIAQACATSAACVQAAAATVELSPDELVLALATDRTSNGPLLVYPAPSRMAGAPITENWVLDNFNRDPWAGEAMIQTAENVAREAQIPRQQLDEVTHMRYQQYSRSLADDRAFQRRYMVPVVIDHPKGPPIVVEADEGIFPTSLEGLSQLKPVRPDGVVTFGTQTHPADGTAGMLICGSAERARELGTAPGVVRILATGVARVPKAQMPKAPVPAAHKALADAGLSFAQVDAMTTHNPFAVNDVWLSEQTGYPLDRMNAYGCSLVYGHPQGPTGLRAMAELIEILRLRGGGIGLFTGCAAGDTGAAVVFRVED